MDIFEAINKRRSVRAYEDAPVPREDLERIVAAAVEAPSGCNMQLRQYVIIDEPAVVDKLRPMSGALKGAQAVIVLLADPQGTRFGEFWMQDASAAMQNMLLAATALGYGSCWVEGELRPHEAELRKILGVPDDLRVWSLTPIGKPANIPNRPPKPSAAEITHHNSYRAK